MKVSVIYYTETGNTEAMANAIVEGIENAGAEANLVDVNLSLIHISERAGKADR